MIAEQSGRARLVVADDSLVIREGLRALCVRCGLEVVAVCADAAALERALEQERPHVMVTEIRMPARTAENGDGGEPVEAAPASPNLGVVVMSAGTEPEHAHEFMASGAGGRAYLLRDGIDSVQRLLDAVETVRAGGCVIDAPILDMLVATPGAVGISPLQELTPRERQILAQIAEAKTNGAIARSLILTKRAVEKHVNSIFGKLDLHDAEDVSPRVQATLLYLHSRQSHNGDRGAIALRD